MAGNITHNQGARAPRRWWASHSRRRQEYHSVKHDEFIIDGDPKAVLTLVLAHGAGGPMDSPFMETVAHALAGNDLRVVRFEFPYMQAPRTHGKRGAPDRE